MTWIPLVACAVVLLVYARSLRPKPPCSGDCVFCAAGRHAASPEVRAGTALTVTPFFEERRSA